MVHKAEDHASHADDHYNSLNKVGECGGKISAEEKIERRECRKRDHYYPTVNSEYRSEQTADSVVNRCGVGNEKYEYYNG